MVEECTINVGFLSYFGTLRQSGNSKTPLRLAIITECRSTQPTTPKKIITKLSPILFFIE